MELSVSFNESELVSKIAESLDLSDIADEISIHDLSYQISDRIDLSDLAEYVHLDIDDVAEALDLNDLADDVISKRDFFTSVFAKLQSDRGVFDIWVDEWMKCDRFEQVRVALRDEMTVWFYEHVAPDLPKNWRKKFKKRVKRKSKKGAV